MRKIFISITICLMLTFLVSMGHADIINVPGDQPTIAAGIEAAVGGDEVVVAADTYYESSISFGGKAITVRSSDGPKTTIVDNGGNGVGFGFIDKEGPDSVLDGFTIQNHRGTKGGGGIAINGASPTIVNCIIIDNEAAGDDTGSGGGILIIADKGASSPTIIGCLIAGNSATGDPDMDAGYGGGICSTGGAIPTIVNCTITKNDASAGGGIACPVGDAIIINSILWGNTSQIGDDDIIVGENRMVDISYSDLGAINPIGTGTIIPGDGMLNYPGGVDPLFVVGDAYYHLDNVSPCIGAGDDVLMYHPYAATDIDGKSRPGADGGTPDIGADENDRESPLAVSLSAFTATSNGDNIILNWRTESEVNNLGFNVYRSKRLDGDYVKVTPALIMGAGTEATPREYSFTDEYVVVGRTYYYYIEDMEFSGKTNKSDIIEITVGEITVGKIIEIKVGKPVKSVSIIPKNFALFQNFPNPFNPETWIPYQLYQDVSVTIRIYNTRGQLIRSLHLGTKQVGSYITKERAAYWDGRDNLAQKVASGVYFYTLQVRPVSVGINSAIPSIGAGQFTETRKMLILK